jgi:membrane fusion protein (multidrug efflux system)
MSFATVSQRPEVTERFGQNNDIPEPCPEGKTVMYRDRESAGGLADTTGRPVWQQEEERPLSPAGRSPAEEKPVAAEPAGPIAAEQAEPPAARPQRKIARKALIAGAVLAALLAGGAYGSYYWSTGRYLVATDDAYVGAKNTTLSAKVPGYVSFVMVEDNAPVRTGDVIAKIDDGDYVLAVDSARGKVATQKATVTRIGKQVEAQQATIDQARAQLASAQAGATRAELELARQQSLAARDFASKQALETAQANKLQTAAAVKGAQAAVEAAESNTDVLKAQQEEAARTLKELEIALAKAERDLSFTVIRAPMDGVIGNRAMQVGDYVQPGQRLASLVPLDAVYVDANFKETQLQRVQPGQPVTISVDALGGRKIDGTVASVAPASGSVFSLLPPDNATGNFTKVVQRVPVRIEVSAELAMQGVLRPGMSVIVSVDTKPGAVASVPVRTATRGGRVR